MSTSLQNDLDYAYAVLDGKIDEIHRGVFANTNEDLLTVFNKLNAADKNVLAVMSSADYLIMSYLFGAKSVDCFDINPITYRYFYLRKWLIQNGIIDYGFCPYEKLLEIVDGLDTPSLEVEKESLEFWREIIKCFNEYNHWDNRLITTKFSPLHYYYHEERKNEIRGIISSANPTFYNIDICKRLKLSIDRKYDYIFVSNILDCGNRNPERLEIFRQNLLGMLNSGGKVVCTHIPRFANEDYSQELDLEKRCFQQSFEYSDIDCNRYTYYQYTKR